MHNKIELRFHSKVRREYYNQLEKLFFFNENQDRYRSRIIELVEKYGEPYIEKDKEKITIKLEKIETECLFASIGPKLVGVLVYKKNHISNNLAIIHIAIDEKYNNKINKNSDNILDKMLNKLFKQYKIADIKSFYISYINKKIVFEKIS